jgi:predicted ATPase/DNA-binding SARP family transcriptional activator
LPTKRPSIRFRTLGSVELYRQNGGERESILTQHKRLALLAYLVLARPTGFHHRDTLLGLFWPEHDQDAGRHALRQALYLLRSKIGQKVILTRGREEIGVAPGSIWCDALAFDAALETGETEVAMELYGDGDFLPGFFIGDASKAFEEWLEIQRARLRQGAISAAATLTKQAERAGDLPKATEWLRHWSVLDPADERVVRALISMLDRLGDRTGAIEAYENHAGYTLREYGVQPAPETRSAIETIRTRQQIIDEGEHALQWQPTPFIGRQGQVDEVGALLETPPVRLVTLTGPAGVGKTRLSLEVTARTATRFEHGARVVTLASTDTDGVCIAIAQSLGVRMRDDASVLQALIEFLAQMELLLVLDNFEHVLSAAPLISTLLERAPRLSVLVTSRSPLRLRAEHEYAVPPLGLPSQEASLSQKHVQQTEAVALFVERARAVQPAFQLTDENVSAVVEICRRLDGLPLAIELAAARVNTFPPETITSLLERRFDLLTTGARDAPGRHHGLENTIRWSDALLTQKEREFFYALSLFENGCVIKSIEDMWVAAGGSQNETLQLLVSLVEKSLLEQVGTRAGTPHFRMLETIREYARCRLEETGTLDEWAERQSAYYVDMVEAGRCYLCTSEQGEWLDHLEFEHANLRGVLRWQFSRGDAATALRLSSSLWQFWLLRGHLTEGRQSLGQALDLCDDGVDTVYQARALLGAGVLASWQNDQPAAIDHLERSLALYRQLDDKTSIGQVLINLGSACRDAGDTVRARVVFDEALAVGKAENNLSRVAAALENLGAMAQSEDDLQTASEMLEMSVELARSTGNHHRLAHGLLSLGDLARREDDFDRAVSLYERSLEHYRRLNETLGMAESLSGLGDMARLEGGTERARELYAQALALYRKAGYAGGVAGTLVGFAALQLVEERPKRAIRLCGRVDAMLESDDVSLEPHIRAEFEAAKEAVRSTMGGRDFVDGWTEGREMTTEEVVFLALHLSPHVPGPAPVRKTGTPH